MVEIEIRLRFSRVLAEIHPRSTSKFSLNLPKLPVGLRKLRSLHLHSASPRPARDGRVFGVSSEAPFLLPLSRVRRQTTRTRLYLRAPKGPSPVSAKRRQKALWPGRSVRAIGTFARDGRWVGVPDADRQRLSTALTRLARTIETIRHGGGPEVAQYRTYNCTKS